MENSESKYKVEINVNELLRYIIKMIMEYFYEKAYIDWEIDPFYSSTENCKFYMKGDERVEITIYEDAIIERKKNVKTPHTQVRSYYSNKTLKYSGRNFYQMHIGKWQEYLESGELIQETDWDEPYKFSICDVIKKIKTDYNVDLNDRNEEGSLDRLVMKENKQALLYEVSLKSLDNHLKRDYILLDGLTGETIFISHYYVRGGEKNPFAEYLESIKTNEEEKRAIYREKNGEKYTKEEWQKYEEEFHEEWKRKHRN